MAISHTSLRPFSKITQVFTIMFCFASAELKKKSLLTMPSNVNKLLTQHGDSHQLYAEVDFLQTQLICLYLRNKILLFLFSNRDTKKSLILYQTGFHLFVLALLHQTGVVPIYSNFKYFRLKVDSITSINSIFVTEKKQFQIRNKTFLRCKFFSSKRDKN